jgi:hypothetical protein
MLVGTYEKFLIRSICQALLENGVFVDIGANVGFFPVKLRGDFKKLERLPLSQTPGFTQYCT